VVSTGDLIEPRKVDIAFLFIKKLQMLEVTKIRL
jgi:hypothetical protein